MKHFIWIIAIAFLALLFLQQREEEATPSNIAIASGRYYVIKANQQDVFWVASEHDITPDNLLQAEQPSPQSRIVIPKGGSLDIGTDSGEITVFSEYDLEQRDPEEWLLVAGKGLVEGSNWRVLDKSFFYSTQ